MIVSVRGANGAGKTTLARAVMDECTVAEVKYRAGRKRPIGQILLHSSGSRIFVPGHYEIANGGIDNIADLDLIYSLIREHAELGLHVLYEGHNQEDGVRRLIALRDAGLDCRVVFLNTTAAECARRVRARGHRIDPKRIERLCEKLRRDFQRFVDAKVWATMYNTGKNVGATDLVKKLLLKGE